MDFLRVSASSLCSSLKVTRRSFAATLFLLPEEAERSRRAIKLALHVKGPWRGVQLPGVRCRVLLTSVHLSGSFVVPLHHGNRLISRSEGQSRSAVICTSQVGRHWCRGHGDLFGVVYLSWSFMVFADPGFACMAFEQVTLGSQGFFTVKVR
jgi:hypothetical protein